MSATTTIDPGVSRAHPLRNVDFRSLWIGMSISIFGDQFYLVALPWLVLLYTGSGVALGTILMVGAVPRAALMIIGGVVTDRISARRILISTATTRMVLVAVAAVLLYFHVLHLWHLYFLALAFGIADAFAMPAGQALMPMIVRQEQLPAATALIGSSAQVCSIAGPAPAGFVLRIWGVAAAFVIDAVSFLFVILALLRLKDAPPSRGPARGGIWKLIREGLQYVMKDAPMRSLMLLVTVLNFCVGGPLEVGLAVISKQWFGSAAVYGTLLSAMAAGMLLGSFLPALIKSHHRGLVVLGFSGVVGCEMIAMGLLHHLIPLMVLLAILGFGNGLAAIYVQSWFQGHVERSFLGRVMSIFMFAAFGLQPLSFAIAGILVQVRISLMFLGAGIFVLIATFIAAVNKQVRAID